MKINRFKENPIIRPNMDRRMGCNINGPSLIRAPDWLENPLGHYYLYFAHHHGTYIRLAYSDRLEGPWRTYEPGTLRLDDAFCIGHIASPDVHIDNARKEIRMYYHGPMSNSSGYWFSQGTHLALSQDGLCFTGSPEILGPWYFRVFHWRDHYYALGMPGVFYRSTTGITAFEEGPTLFSPNMRHSALLRDEDTLYVFYTNVQDCPERILLSTIHLDPNWMTWQESEPIPILEPEMVYKGVNQPLEPSVRGWVPTKVRQLRDPAIFREDNRVYLLYSVAGEHGIAIAEVQCS